MGLSSVGPEEVFQRQDGSWHGRVELGQKRFKIEKKEFQVITDLINGKFWTRIVERSGERIIWVKVWVTGFKKLVKELEECRKMNFEDPFESSWDDVGRKVSLVQWRNRAGTFILLLAQGLRKKIHIVITGGKQREG